MILLYDLVGADETVPFSPHCWKIKMALEHKGLLYRTVPTRFLEVPGIEGGASQTVPVIRDGDRVVADSFHIATYLEEAYPERPSLFRGKGGEALSRFVERWSQTQLHPYLGAAALSEINARQDEANQAYFRESREQRFGKSIEAASAERDQGLAAFQARLEPLRSMLGYQPFIGGQTPLFADYIVFGALQWVRVISTYRFIEDEVIQAWFDRCLDLHGGAGRRAPAAA